MILLPRILLQHLVTKMVGKVGSGGVLGRRIERSEPIQRQRKVRVLGRYINV